MSFIDNKITSKGCITLAGYAPQLIMLGQK